MVLRESHGYVHIFFKASITHHDFLKEIGYTIGNQRNNMRD
jgi:hypothetical protein